MRNSIHRGQTRRCCSQLARHKKSKLSCLQGIAIAASLTASKHMTQGLVPSSSSSAISCRVLLRISCRTVASSAMKQPELSVCPGHCLSIVLARRAKKKRRRHRIMRRLARGWVTFFYPGGQSLGLLLPRWLQEIILTLHRLPSFVSQLNSPLISHSFFDSLFPNAMLKSAKSVVSAVGAYKQLHNMPLNGIASASHTITNLKRWSVAGKELPGISVCLQMCIAIAYALALCSELTRNYSCVANQDNSCVRL